MTDQSTQETGQPAMQPQPFPQVVDMTYLSMMAEKIEKEYQANKSQFDAFVAQNANAARVIQLAIIGLQAPEGSSDE